jgi:uncharacterized RDD family membrane protein YckC
VSFSKNEELISTTDKPLTITQCVLRFFLGLISLTCAGVGFLWILVDKNNDTLHDNLCKTRMIRTEKMAKKRK